MRIPGSGNASVRPGSPWTRLRAARADLRAARARTEQLLGITESLGGQLQQCQASIAELATRVERLGGQLDANRELQRVDHERTMLGLRMARDDDARSWQQLWELRRQPDFELPFSTPDPLITVIITTYNRAQLLTERALPSVLAQTHRNWECLVMGDAASAETAEAVQSLGDPRIRFVNLPYRGPYPDEFEHAWLVWGGNPFNTGLQLARGHWFGFVSDDDALVPSHLESLLALARAERAELAYGQLRWRNHDGSERILGVPAPPRHGTWGLQSSLFHRDLRFIPLLANDWVFSVPIDWSWAERLLRIGVRMAHLPEPVVDYFPSREWDPDAGS